MKILVTGKGGREHALIQTLAESARSTELYAWPGSDAMETVASRPEANNLEELVAWMRETGIELCVAGEESHLADGLADRCSAAGIPVWGPVQAAARLESSKAHAKAFMRRHRIPTGGYDMVDSASALRAAVSSYPCVLKFDGLAAGKGVAVCEGREAVDAFVREVYDDRRFGEGPVLVEEFLEGNELSVICAVAGRDYVVFPAARDYKRLGEGDVGPNTGGMGAVASTAMLDDELRETVERTIIRPTVDGLLADGVDYHGFLYFGLMLTADGPKVLEYNCRFGDPEAQAVLPLVKGDFAGFLRAGATGAMRADAISFRDGWSLCVVLASAGYPASSGSGEVIEGLSDLIGATAFHSGTRRCGDGYVTDGGRVLALSARGETREQARERAYGALAGVGFPGAQMRRDIGEMHF